MATFRKRGDRWQVQVRRYGHLPLSRSFKLRSDAEAWARQVESEMERGIYLDRSAAETTLLEEALERYGREVSPTKACHKTDLSRIKHLSRHLGKISLARLDSSHLAKYRDMRLSCVSGQSVRAELMLLNRILVRAQQEWRITLPRGIPSVRKPSMPEGRKRRLEAGEYEKLMSALKGSPPVRVAVTLAIETAMRRGELARMRWEDINWATRIVHIPITKTGRSRSVPLSISALSALRSLPRRTDGQVLGLRPDSLTQAYERACRRSGLQNLRFHDLRHEATSRLFERGLNTLEVSTITGHQTLQMLQRYTHLRPEQLVHRLA